MPKERHTVLREALAAIEATDREVEAARAVSEARGSSYCRYVLAREELEDSKKALDDVTEAATQAFLVNAAAHDVRHGIHRTELRLASRRSATVTEALPWLRHLRDAETVAASTGHVSRSRWRGRVVEQLCAFEAAVREPVRAGGLGLAGTDDLVVGLRVLKRGVNACTGADAMTQLKKLQTRSIELAAEADPAHFGALEKTRKAAEARFLKTAKIDATRARRMLDAVDKDALHLARATYRETTLKARAARDDLAALEDDGATILDHARAAPPPGGARRRAAPPSTTSAPTEVLLAPRPRDAHLPAGGPGPAVVLRRRRRRADGGGDGFGGGVASPRARAMDDVLDAAPTPIPKKRPPLSPPSSPGAARRRAAPGTLSTKGSQSAATLAAFSRPAKLDRDLFADAKHLEKLTVTKASEAAVAEACHRALVECGIAGDWRAALAAYRAMVAKGLAPTLRTWRALLRACKVGDAPAGHAFAILEEIEAQTAARAGRDGLVDVSIYNAVIDICGHAGAWRRALQVFNRLRHHGIAPTTHTYSCVMAAAVGVPADSTEVYEGLKFAGIPEYIAYTAATAHALSWKPHASAAAKASHYNDTSLRRASTSGASSSFAFSSRGSTDGADRGDASGAPYRAPGT
ncbi:endonuclease [Aureococcus anophagefferens]|uniref:Endonuclease n=1 Tax=Aureococcus anophagefferens TaxID=44056 RepID=A0ABR1G283_AURAN